MMRRFLVLGANHDEYEMWLNPDHVVSVAQKTDGRVHVRTTTGAIIEMRGQARNVALELNGHFDE